MLRLTAPHFVRQDHHKIKLIFIDCVKTLKHNFVFSIKYMILNGFECSLKGESSFDSVFTHVTQRNSSPLWLFPHCPDVPLLVVEVFIDTNQSRCGYRIDSAARSTRGPALTDDVSTLEYRHKSTDKTRKGCYKRGSRFEKKAQSVWVLISLNAARSFAFKLLFID